MKAKVEKYIKDVTSGATPTGRLVKLAVARYMRDREEGPSRGIVFDEEAATRACDFFEDYLHHTTGKWRGKPFVLEGWQAFILWNLFGFKRKEDQSRRFRIAYTETARKQGKSTMSSGVGLYSLIADGEPRAEVYSAATKRDQARIVFSEAQRMIRSNTDLKRFCKVLTHNISVPEFFSKFEPLGADSDTLDGLNVSCALVDELHMHKSRELWDKLGTATGSRASPLIFAITTAGFDRSTVCWEKHEYGENVLNGVHEDDAFFCFIACMDEDDDWTDEKNWQKANPNLGVTVDLRDLREEADRVKNDPRGLNPFLRYKLNRWTESESSWLTPEQWDRNNHGPIDLTLLRGKKCYCGLDLAAKRDTTALVFVFPPEDPDNGLYTVVPYIFIPGDTLFEREKIERIPWVSWRDQGFIYTTKGRVTDPHEVLAKLKELDAMFDIRDLVYDRWNMDLIAPYLREMGWPDSLEDGYSERHSIEFGQGWKSMSPASRCLEEMAIAGRLSHGGHPALSYQVSCVAMVGDHADNIRPSKKKSTGRIDAVVALAMGLFHAKLVKPTFTSVYDDPDFNPLDSVI